jgi:hypothetical protein
MSQNLFKTAAILTATIGSAITADAANVVVNGDFSANATAFTTFPGYRSLGANPEIQDWAFTDLSGGAGGNAGLNGTGTVTTAFGPADQSAVGTYAFIQNGTALLSQGLTTLQPSQTYTISFQAANRNGNDGAVGRVQIGDEAAVIYSSGDQSFSTAAFETVTTTFTTPASFTGTPSIQLYSFVAGDNTVAYSNIVVEAIPEPSGALLLGIGGLLSFARRRR